MKIKQAYVFNKLMKDLMPQELALHEITLHGYVLSDKEFFHELVTNRLQEEAQELAVAQGVEEQTAELADILEIVHALAGACGITMHQVEQARIHKKSKRGGFSKKLYAVYAAAPDGSLGHAYYKNNQHKHPAIPLPPVDSEIHELE